MRWVWSHSCGSDPGNETQPSGWFTELAGWLDKTWLRVVVHTGLTSKRSAEHHQSLSGLQPAQSLVWGLLLFFLSQWCLCLIMFIPFLNPDKLKLIISATCSLQCIVTEVCIKKQEFVACNVADRWGEWPSSCVIQSELSSLGYYLDRVWIKGMEKKEACGCVWKKEFHLQRTGRRRAVQDNLTLKCLTI